MRGPRMTANRRRLLASKRAPETGRTIQAECQMDQEAYLAIFRKALSRQFVGGSRINERLRPQR